MNTFSIGDAVTWETQSKGRSKTHTGYVVAIVPAKRPVGFYIPKGFDFDMAVTERRDHDSYVVQVPSRRRAHWPEVASLSAAKLSENLTKAISLAKITKGSKVAERVIAKGGCIAQQDGEWFLFRKSGDSVGAGAASLLYLLEALAAFK